MILERQWQKTNKNINETYFINIKENIWKQNIVKGYTIKSTACKS